MIEKLFNYYSNKYKVEWLPNGDIDVYDKSLKQEEHIGFVIYFDRNNKEYALTIDSEMIFILKKKRCMFTNKTYWKQANHVHIEHGMEEEIIEIIQKCLMK